MTVQSASGPQTFSVPRIGGVRSLRMWIHGAPVFSWFVLKTLVRLGCLPFTRLFGLGLLVMLSFEADSQFPARGIAATGRGR